MATRSDKGDARELTDLAEMAEKFAEEFPKASMAYQRFKELEKEIRSFDQRDRLKKDKGKK
jgi:hypothetical protein